MNKVILIGNVGKDPEVRTFDNGNKVAGFSLATNKKIKGEKVTQWHNIQVWGKSVDVVEKFVKKGSQIAVEGEITYREYEKDSVKRYVTEINSMIVTLLGSTGKSDSENGGDANPDSMPASPF